ncbi:MAG: Chemotaxis response regulator protein-glutamate methylesterase [Rickettsiaceae bacterium]|jgi:two-component system chemotaxis response regulator CheB|nr:Chemotaxis response regulator protein-glutamate methylesterase [Rickettsiaceae bacterium]
MTQKIEVMIIDDSPTIRGAMRLILQGDSSIEVREVASNGLEALQKLDNASLRDSLDVILIDIEMPVMDGREAIPQIRELMKDVKIIIVTSLSRSNIECSIEALMKYADEYILKPSVEGGISSREEFSREILQKVVALGSKKVKDEQNLNSYAKPEYLPSENNTKIFNINNTVIIPRPHAIAIGASTGGPQAISSIFSGLKNYNFDIPIFITLHMPKNFTTLFASNLSIISGKECIEAREGEKVQAGKIYIAPGDYHMEIIGNLTNLTISLNQNPQEHFCRPSVNPMLRSLAKIYGARLLEVMLTGMGNDGIEGSRMVVEKGGAIIAQDEHSSVVWGMPGAVVKENLSRKVLPLELIAQEILRIMHG